MGANATKSQDIVFNIEPADKESLKTIFLKYATVTKSKEKFITYKDFVTKFLVPYADPPFTDVAVELLAGIADTDKDGLISFEEFQAFERLLCTSDALHRATFQLFKCKGSDSVSFSDFRNVVQKTDLYSKIPFNFSGSFVNRHFGRDKKRSNNYGQFTQLINEFPNAYQRDAFNKRSLGSGYISSKDFQDIITKTRRYSLTADVADHLKLVTKGEHVSFVYFKAFSDVLADMDLIKNIYLEASKGSKTKLIEKEEITSSAQASGRVSPLQIDILFQILRSVGRSPTEEVTYRDLCYISPNYFEEEIRDPGTRTVYSQILESCYKFMLGSIGGATGAAVVYPIDLVKTRMQNQRLSDSNNTIIYKNSFDCFRKVLRTEGFPGLYRGILPHLCGVAPEKAFKLAINDLMREKLTDANGNISMYGEVFSGASSGVVQVLITNPLDVIKIRLQVAGEVERALTPSAMSVARELGINGLYRGTSACILRDVLFTTVYFPTYSHSKAMLADENGYNGPVTLLSSGIIAGIPAAFLATPADVIKTRMQVAPRKGQTHYKGFWDCTRKIMREEGPRAFWKGVLTRVLRSSPQFGITLITYELLHRLLKVDFGGSVPKQPSPTVQAVNRDHIGGYKAFGPVLTGIESKFGLYLPRYSRKQVAMKR